MRRCCLACPDSPRHWSVLSAVNKIGQCPEAFGETSFPLLGFITVLQKQTKISQLESLVLASIIFINFGGSTVVTSQPRRVTTSSILFLQKSRHIELEIKTVSQT